MKPEREYRNKATKDVSIMNIDAKKSETNVNKWHFTMYENSDHLLVQNQDVFSALSY